MEGTLRLYHKKKRLVFFESTPDEPNKVIFIGGLGDSWLATSYLKPLAEALTNIHWSLIQVI